MMNDEMGEENAELGLGGPSRGRSGTYHVPLRGQGKPWVR
jgi:hypothetical protein